MADAQTTICCASVQDLRFNKWLCSYVNLDPAAEDFAYEPDLDIKELISLKDVMEEMGLGLNGALISCFEYTLKNYTKFYVLRILTEARFLLGNPDFLAEAMDQLTAEYLIILNLHGKRELYTHIPVVQAIVKHLTRTGALEVNLRAAFPSDQTSSSMVAMIMLEIRHINVFSEINLVKDRGIILGGRYCEREILLLGIDLERWVILGRA